MDPQENSEGNQTSSSVSKFVAQNLPLFSNYHAGVLGRINPATFRFMSQEQKNTQVAQLKQALDIFRVQRTILKTIALRNAIWVCEFYIFLLVNRTAEELAGDAPVKYQGLPIGQELGKQVHTLTDRFLDTSQDTLSLFHQSRLYWRSAGGLANSVISVLPRDSFHTEQATNLFGYQQQPYGYLSWVIAYARFAINLYLLVEVAWTSKKYSNETFFSRFKTEWEHRKFILLDTFLSGTVNLVCFFWMTGSAALQYAASFVNMAALCCDLGLTLWMREHQTTLYEKKCKSLINEIRKLESLPDTPANKQQLETTKEMLSNLQKEWNYTSTKINYGLIATVATILGTLVLLGFLCPPALLPAAATLALTITGLAIGLTCTLIFQYKTEQLDRKKTKDILSEKKALLATKVEKWLELETMKEHPENYQETLASCEDQQKLLYLEIQGLESETTEQQRLFEYQRNRHLFSLLTKILVPIIITTSLVLAPLGIGLPILSVVICGLLLAQLFLNQKKPKVGSAPEFYEEQYQVFRKSTLAKGQIHTTKEQMHGIQENDDTPHPIGPDISF